MMLWQKVLDNLKQAGFLKKSINIDLRQRDGEWWDNESFLKITYN